MTNEQQLRKKFPYQKFIYELGKKYISCNSKVIDIGCGIATKSLVLKNFTSDIVIADLKNYLTCFDLNFKQISADDYGDIAYDVVTSFEVIEHVDEEKMFISQLINITKPGGYIIIGTPNLHRWSNQLLALVGRQPQFPRNLGGYYKSGDPVIHLREYSMRNLIELASSFDQIEIEEAYSGFKGIYSPWGAIGLKKLNKRKKNCFDHHLFIVLRKK